MSEAVNNGQYLVRVEELGSYYRVRRGVLRGGRGVVRAVDGVSFEIKAGESFGVVGESGCGKTTLGLAIAGLGCCVEGNVFFDGLDVLRAGGEAMRRFRGDVSVVFQEAYGSLNPRMRVGRIVGEPLVVQRIAAGSELEDRVAGLLCGVGLGGEVIGRYPHELSAGQRQRVAIARALAVEPRLVICDEPVSSLDASVRAQILNLLKDLQAERGLTYLFISHDLRVVECFCDVVAVMYEGRIVEQGQVRDVYERPQHRYTRELLGAIVGDGR